MLQWNITSGLGVGAASFDDIEMPTNVPEMLSWVFTQDFPVSSARSTGDDAGPGATVHWVHLDPGKGGLVVVVLLDSSTSVGGQRGAPVTSPVTVDIIGLCVGCAYRLRARCHNVGDVLGPWAPTQPQWVSPQPPLISSIVVEGGLLPTAGGTSVDMWGDRMGIPGSVVTLTLAHQALGSFTSLPCQVVLPGVQVRCPAPAGAGDRLLAFLTVDSAPGPPFVNGTVSYAPPSVSTVAIEEANASSGHVGCSASGSSTAGGCLVVLTGANFGAKDLPQGALGPVTFKSAGLSPVFTAKNCSVSVSHVEARCTMPSGVGGVLQFVITIAGQASALPRTSYRSPVVRAVGLLLGDGTVGYSLETLCSLSTAGGQTLVFVGDYLGPSQSQTQIVATGDRVGGASISTSACRVVGEGHTQVWCSSPQGVGAGFAWSLLVAGQRSLLSAGANTTSYGRPTVARVTITVKGEEVAALPTAGGATVSLWGSNFGQSASAVVVTWAGVVLRDVFLRVSHHSLSFLSPASPGAEVTVAVTVDGQSAAPAPPAADTDPILLHFLPPLVVGVKVDPALQLEPTMDCSLVREDGYPEGGHASASAVLSITGLNFGDGSLTQVTIRGEECKLDRNSSSHDRIVCTTPLCEGEVSSMIDARSYGQVLQRLSLCIQG